MKLPQRVMDLVNDQEDRSERLIGWFQLAIAATFASLFFIAPRPPDAGMPMYEPVPIALAAYTLFTVVRLFLSYRIRMPAWFLVLSILFDMMLLIGLIWSFHLQYEQPAAFSLKVPTFIYIFVFIALRALRFDHRFVLLSGLFAAAGWGLLLAWSISVSPDDIITRNFSEYLNGNRILRGAEFDKIFTILVVTGVLSFAIWRARQTLLTAISAGAASQEMRRFLTEGLADHIAQSEDVQQAGSATERDAAIMMIDIRGFTEFSSGVEPTDIVNMLTDFHGRIVPLIESHGGVVDKFLGDGVMVTFGAVQPSETAAADALRALEAVLQETGRWRKDLKQRGIATDLDVNGSAVAGPVVFATLGNADRLEFTVIGRAVNLAAKLEKHNKEEKTRGLTPRTTLELAEQQGYIPGRKFEHRQGCAVAGVPDVMDLVGFVK